jgi:hypothetical protein
MELSADAFDHLPFYSVASYLKKIKNIILMMTITAKQILDIITH